MDQKTLPTIWHTYMKLVTKYQIPVINSCLEKCDEKCAYTNVCPVLVAFFSATIDGRNLIFCGKRFFDPSDSYFLFAEERGYQFHLVYINT
jgi:hypothetical protein